MTTRDAYQNIRHIFNIDDTYKNSFMHWLSLFETAYTQDKRDVIINDMISWMENVLFISVSDHSRKRIGSIAAELCSVEKKPKPVVKIAAVRAPKQVEPDKALLDEVASEICLRKGITIDGLKERTRKREKVKAMVTFIREVMSRYPFSDGAVAEYLGITRTSVLYHRNDGVIKAKKRRYQRMRSI